MALKLNEKLLCIGIVISGLAGTFGLIQLVRISFEKVKAGHGLDYFTTVWGYQFNYLGFLILFAIFALTCFLLPAIRWLGEKEERDFKKKYHIDE